MGQDDKQLYPDMVMKNNMDNEVTKFTFSLSPYDSMPLTLTIGVQNKSRAFSGRW
jgi:hypothetical protein